MQISGAITYIYTKKNGLYFVINTKAVVVIAREM